MADTQSILDIAIPQTKRFEAFRSHAYPDPLTKGDPFTVGYGETNGITATSACTEEEASRWLDDHLTTLCDVLDNRIPWWRDLDPARAAVPLEMAYQLGPNGLMGFPHMLGYLRAFDYANAAAQMMNSVWATQTPKRAGVLAEQMRSGIVA